MITVARYLASKLRDHGVHRFFGIPGGPSIPYMEAFRKNGIEFILTSHESSAAVMADVTSRLTGVTGICHATFGPGATNLSTGVGGALLDRSPATYRLSAENAPSVIDEAPGIANNEYPAPVHIGLPSDLSGKMVKDNIKKKAEKKRQSDDHVPERVKVLLASSRRPLLAVGLTAMRHRMGADLIRPIISFSMLALMLPSEQL